MLSEFQRPAAVEKLEQVAFMRLVPRDLHRGDGAEVQAVDQRRFEQARAESRVLRDGGDYQGGSDLVEHVRLRDLHHTCIGTKELPVGQRVGERITQDDGGKQIRGAFEGDLAVAAPILGRDIAGTRASQPFLDRGIDALRHSRIGKGRQPGVFRSGSKAPLRWPLRYLAVTSPAPGLRSPSSIAASMLSAIRGLAKAASRAFSS